jgi:hypothetical protein
VFGSFFAILISQYLFVCGGTIGNFNFFPATLPALPCMFALHMILTPIELQCGSTVARTLDVATLLGHTHTQTAGILNLLDVCVIASRLVVGVRASLCLLLCIIFVFLFSCVSRNSNSALFTSLTMASAEDHVICDHSDWPTWFVVELASKYIGCKFYRPPSKPPPLVLFRDTHSAETSLSAVLSTNSSVTDSDDDDESSDSFEAAVRGKRLICKMGRSLSSSVKCDPRPLELDSDALARLNVCE